MNHLLQRVYHSQAWQRISQVEISEIQTHCPFPQYSILELFDIDIDTNIDTTIFRYIFHAPLSCVISKWGRGFKHHLLVSDKCCKRPAHLIKTHPTRVDPFYYQTGPDSDRDQVRPVPEPDETADRTGALRGACTLLVSLITTARPLCFRW